MGACELLWKICKKSCFKIKIFNELFNLNKELCKIDYSDDNLLASIIMLHQSDMKIDAVFWGTMDDLLNDF